MGSVRCEGRRARDGPSDLFRARLVDIGTFSRVRKKLVRLQNHEKGPASDGLFGGAYSFAEVAPVSGGACRS
jgi:hypothetical protein